MTPFKNSAVIGLVLGATLGAPTVFVAACSSSSSNNNPAPPVYADDASSDSTTNVGDGAPGNPDAQDESTTPNADGQGPAGEASLGDAPANSDAGVTTPSCTSALTDAGCWTCPAASAGSVEFLNQCSGTGVKCVAFDPSRLPGIDAGRPPLN
jgi:hypothetical protein